MSSPSSLESRLARVEQTLAILSAEVASIRRELGVTASPVTHETRAEPSRLTVAPGAVPVTSARSRRAFAPSAVDLERLVGTYGMLVIAVLAAVAAVGTFLSW